VSSAAAKYAPTVADFSDLPWSSKVSSETTVHPLAQYVDLDAEPMAPRFVIPGFIGYGLVIFAGSHGVGKTTALLPLAMVAAGLHRHGDPLAPKHWRHVVYITEDTEQARRIVAGVVKFGGLGLEVGTVRERLHIVEARRLEPAYVVEVATTYREQFARTVDGVEVPPLVVADTKASVFSIEEESSNSEASAIVAMLKQSFENLPVWLVGHVAKANMSRADVAGLSLRGASAFEADANQVLYLVKEG
jgi:RecA-family ATPase